MRTGFIDIYHELPPSLDGVITIPIRDNGSSAANDYMLVFIQPLAPIPSS
jgi:hypothetical protein